MKKFQFCAEDIQADAVKCKHCGEWVKTEHSKINPIKYWLKNNFWAVKILLNLIFIYLCLLIPSYIVFSDNFLWIGIDSLISIGIVIFLGLIYLFFWKIKPMFLSKIKMFLNRQ